MTSNEFYCAQSLVDECVGLSIDRAKELVHDSYGPSGAIPISQYKGFLKRLELDGLIKRKPIEKTRVGNQRSRGPVTLTLTFEQMDLLSELARREGLDRSHYIGKLIEESGSAR